MERCDPIAGWPTPDIAKTVVELSERCYGERKKEHEDPMSVVVLVAHRRLELIKTMSPAMMKRVLEGELEDVADDEQPDQLRERLLRIASSGVVEYQDCKGEQGLQARAQTCRGDPHGQPCEADVRTPSAHERVRPQAPCRYSGPAVVRSRR